MCGRYSVSAKPAAIQARFNLDQPIAEPPRAEFALPRFNVAPTQDIVIVRMSTAGERIGVWARWGLVPASAKDLSGGARMINARAETLFSKPVFKMNAQLRRCLVPADGFFEWTEVGPKTKQPYRLRLKDSTIFAMAGIWSRWRGDDGSVVDTASVITCGANGIVQPFHDRMPVILKEDDWKLWLDPNVKTQEALEHLFVPLPEDQMAAVSVSRAVNSVKNDDPKCIEEVEPLKPAEQLGFGFSGS
jgi:putative SOS response-associated peptidase YedK